VLLQLVVSAIELIGKVKDLVVANKASQNSGLPAPISVETFHH
jgi:hypothetical protein